VGSALTFDGDHRFDDAVAMIENGFEGLLDTPERKGMGGHEAGIDRPRGHEAESSIQAVVLAADVLDPEFLAPQSADVEGDPLLEGDADYDDRSPGLQEADGLVDGFLLSTALENEVEAQGLAGHDLRYDIRLEGVPGPIRSCRSGGLEAGDDLFGHEDAADALDLKAEADAQADWPGSQDGRSPAFDLSGQFDRPKAYGKRLGQDASRQVHPFGKGMTIALGHDEEFGEGTVELARTAQKAKMAACMRPSGQALIAMPARNGRFDGHPVPRFDPPHAGAYRLDDGRAFVAQADGIAEVEVAHPRL